jgi:coenzyme PQQ synthesis protein D (PqqD)
MDLSEDSRLEIDPSATFAMVGDEAVVLDMRSGVYYGLNEVAARIWQLAVEQASVGTIASTLAQEFEVDPAVLRADLRRLVRDFEGYGLLRVAP